MNFSTTEEDLLYTLLKNITGQTTPTVIRQYTSTTEDLIASINAAITSGALKGTPHFFTATDGETAFPTPSAIVNTPDVYLEGKKLFLTDNFLIVAGVVTLNIAALEGQRVVVITYP